MNSHPREETLALYSTEDLDAAELAPISEHVVHCEMCRDCVAQYQRLESMMEAVTDEPSAADLHEVRQRVRRTLDKKRRRSWVFQAVAAAAAVLVLAWLLRPNEPGPPPPRIAAVHVPVVRVPPTVTVRTVPVTRRKPRLRAAGLRSVAFVTRPGEAPTVRITTPDPNVVILLPPETQDNERTNSNDK